MTGDIYDAEATGRSALKFALITGVVSLFAVFTYEGSRSVGLPAPTGSMASALGAVLSGKVQLFSIDSHLTQNLEKLLHLAVHQFSQMHRAKGFARTAAFSVI